MAGERGDEKAGAMLQSADCNREVGSTVRSSGGETETGDRVPS